MAGSAGTVEITMLAAVDRRLAIGRGNALPWRLPDDLARFKALTLGKPVLMGRRTAESLGRALPKRRNLVLTRSGRVPFAGMDAVASLDQALALAAADGAAELCVIRGGAVSALALPRASAMHLTPVDTVAEDPAAFFPRFATAAWREAGRQRPPAEAQPALAFALVDYPRPGHGAPAVD